MLHSSRVVLLALLLIFFIVVPGTMPAQSEEELSLTIIPPGQNSSLNIIETIAYILFGLTPPHTDDQLAMYAGLSQSGPGLINSDLFNFFKPAPIGILDAPESFISPRPDVVITRDAFGVPQVWGLEREDVLFGIGYATAQDRLLFMDMLRRAARGRLSEFVGPFLPFAPSLLQTALDFDAQFYAFAGYTDEELQAQFDRLADRFRLAGPIVQRDFAAYVEGVNAYIEFLASNPLLWPVEYFLLGGIEPWQIMDVARIAIGIEVIFGGGGGSEHRNAELFQALTAQFGEQTGAALFRDLRQADDPETPSTASGEFPYLIPGDIDPVAVALPDPGTFVPHPPLEFEPAQELMRLKEETPAPFSGIGVLATMLAKRASRSNFLAVTAEHADGGSPIAVMGPQTGYFIPEVLMEIGYQGDNLAARGVLPPGFPYIIFGRGLNHAWSPTSGGSDMTDVRVERLCEIDGSEATLESNGYMFQGDCLPMYERIDRWCAGPCPDGGTNVTAVLQRTIHGLVFGRATVDGHPVALVRQRASFGTELDAAVAYLLVNRPLMNAARFERSMAVNPASFNWAYIDALDVAYFHSGRYPRRAAGVDPDFPSWGTGEYEWTGLLTPAEQPRERNPWRGYLTSWNNSPAAKWRPADGQYSFGSVHRVQSLNERLEQAIGSDQPVTAAQMVEIMADAGHVDLRGSQVLPWALALLEGVSADFPDLLPALDALETWYLAGAMRRDRDGDGDYEHAGAIALMDAWYDPMIRAVFGPQLDGLFNLIPLGFDDKPSSTGSAYQSGYYGYLQKAFRMALRVPVDSPFEELRCADGREIGCGTALAESLSGAVATLTGLFGSPNPTDWRVDPTAEQIEFEPFGLLMVGPAPWVNRPTFQQVIQFAATP
ncbi:MAG: penicillin acylase family protein [Desulfobacterales bacterium]